MSNYNVIRLAKLIMAKSLGFKYVLNLTNMKVHKLDCRHVKSIKKFSFLTTSEVEYLFNAKQVVLCSSCKPLTK
jgi:hypothetical protein